MSRASPARLLAWACAKGPVGSLVYTSSTSVYPQDGGVRVDETAPVAGRDERTSVLVATEDLLRGTAPAARSRVILRLAGIYGPGRTHLVQQVRTGEVAGTSAQHLNLIHRDDVCTAIWAAFGAPAAPAAEIFNVADDGAATRAEITAWLATQLGVPAPQFTGAPAAGRRAATPDRIIASDRLRATLGWSPRWPSFREGYANLLSR